VLHYAAVAKEMCKGLRGGGGVTFVHNSSRVDSLPESTLESTTRFVVDSKPHKTFINSASVPRVGKIELTGRIYSNVKIEWNTF
jgi:hypothetical protein